MSELECSGCVDAKSNGKPSLTCMWQCSTGKPAPAQSREEEAQAWELVKSALEDYQLMRDACRGKKALEALAALRSRQSPQAADYAIDWKARAELSESSEREGWAKAQRLEAEIASLKASATRPSPQGEDWEKKYKELLIMTDIPAIMAIETRATKAEQERDALRSRLASAQSSAQGEEARELREALRGMVSVFGFDEDEREHEGIALVKARAALERKEGE